MITTELTMLVVIATATAFMWVPYILDSMMVRGIMPTLDNPRADARPLSAWADRAKRAHANAVENLVVFATLVAALQLIGGGNHITRVAAMVYVGARLAHYVVYTAGIPVIRTLLFVVGFGCQVAIASQLL